MVKPGNMEWRVDYMREPWQCGVRVWILRGVIKVFVDEKKALATICLKLQPGPHES